MVPTKLIELVPVSSSAIAAYGFDPETNTLYVKFHSGGTYAYASHPDEWRRLQQAESKGKFYHQNLGRGSGRQYVAKWDKEEDEFAPETIQEKVRRVMR